MENGLSAGSLYINRRTAARPFAMGDETEVQVLGTAAAKAGAF